VPRRLLLANILLGVVGAVLVAALIREGSAARPLPPAPALRASQPSPTSSPALAARSAPVTAYGVIATKNLFSPTRSEVTAAVAPAVGPKPVLHGVKIDGERSRAYLEDPVAKRVFGYAVGDPIGGGRLLAISPDRVAISRPEGTVEVLLQDPSKPKPPPAPTAGSPGAAPSTSGAPAAVVPTPGAPAAVVPSAPAPGTPPSTPGAPAAVVPPAPGSAAGQQVESAPSQPPPPVPATNPRPKRRLQPQ
jgi:hypothetical protein